MSKSGKTKKTRKITETDKAFYRLGFLNGEQQLHETTILLRKTNRELWEELLRLDRVAPVAGVVLTFKEVEMLIAKLKKLRVCPGHRRKLRRKIKEAQLKALITPESF